MSHVPRELDPSSPSSLSDPKNLQKTIAMVGNHNFQWTGTAEDVIEQLQCLQEIDDDFTKKAKFWKRWAIGVGILLFLSLPVGLVVADAQDSFVIFAVVTLPLLILWFACLWMAYRRGRLNVQDRRHQIPARLLQHLKVDIPPQSPVTIALDFRDYHSRKLQTGTTSGGFFSGLKQKTYEVPWLALSGQLYDGSKFRFKIVECVKRKEKAKRKSTKVTETYRDKYSLSLAVKPTHYPGLAKFDQFITTAQVPQDLSIPTVKVAGNRVTIQSLSRASRITSATRSSNNYHDYNNAHSALQLFLSSYHCLGQCRQN